MNIENMLNQLKDILPAKNFKNQPSAAREELIQLEKKYNINTSKFLQDSKASAHIPEGTREKWINTLDIFIKFNGSMKDLNHLPSCEKTLKNISFITQTSKKNSTKEYADKKSKEPDWHPCSFLYMENFINFHSFFWME